MSVTYNLARALGPLLATVSVALLGFGLAFGLNSLSFVALAVAILSISPRGRPTRFEGGSIMEGVRYAWRSRELRMLLVSVAAVSVATDPVFTLSPALAQNVFHRSASQAGLLVSAFGAGAVASAVLVGRLMRRPSGERARVGLAATAVLAAGLAAMALSPVLPLALAALLLAGGGYLITITTLTTAIQESVAEGLRGRVMSLWTLCFLGTRPIAALVDGALSDTLSPRAAALLMLLPLAAAASAVTIRTSRSVRDAASPSG
jgi:predicted MFS family arabinose efflux permease